MRVRRAKAKDLAKIAELCTSCGFNAPKDNVINSQDIAIVAEVDNKVIGFVWCGLMAKNSIGLVDFFIIHPEHRGQKVGESLGQQLIKICELKKVNIMMATIKQDQFHDFSLANGVKIGMTPDEASYSLITRVLGGN